MGRRRRTAPDTSAYNHPGQRIELYADGQGIVSLACLTGDSYYSGLRCTHRETFIRLLATIAAPTRLVPGDTITMLPANATASFASGKRPASSFKSSDGNATDAAGSYVAVTGNNRTRKVSLSCKTRRLRGIGSTYTRTDTESMQGVQIPLLQCSRLNRFLVALATRPPSQTGKRQQQRLAWINRRGSGRIKRRPRVSYRLPQLRKCDA